MAFPSLMFRKRDGRSNGDPFFSYVKLLLTGNGTNGERVYPDSSLLKNIVSEAGTNQVDTSAKKYGTGSILLGSGYLTIPDNPTMEPGTSDFCVEVWIKLNATATGAILRKGNHGDSDFEIRVNTSSLLATGKNQAGIQIFNFSTGPLLSADGLFHHIAFTRSGSTFRIFFDGVVQATQTGVADEIRNSAVGWSIGQDTTGFAGLPSNLDDIRYTLGVARYTSNFTTPTQAHPTYGPVPDPYTANVVSLLHFDGASDSTTFTDAKGVVWTNNGGAKITRDSSFIGGAAGNFDASANTYLLAATTDAWKFSQQFTLEFRIRPTISSAGLYWFGYASNLHSWLYTSTPGNMRMMAFGSEMPVDIPFVIGQWYHIALARDATTLRLFVNGQLVYSRSSTEAITGIPTVQLAGAPSLAGTGRAGRCYVDEFRFTNGVCRYTQSFAPITAAFPDPFPETLGSSVRNALMSWWDFEETSGTSWTDAKGSVSLGTTNVATHTTATGKVGRALKFSSTSAYFAATDSTFAFGNESFTVFLWHERDNTQAVPDNSVLAICSKYVTTGSQRSYELVKYKPVGSNPIYRMNLSPDGVAVVSVDGAEYQNSIGWDFIAFGYDSVLDQAFVIVNGVKSTVAHAGGIFIGTARFTLGARYSASTGGSSNKLGGYDSAGVMSRAITDAEYNLLYNGGAGLNYGQLLLL